MLFIHRFISLVNQRYHELHEEHKRLTGALHCVESASEKAEVLANAMLKENAVLEDKEHSALSFLAQLGQNTAIKEEHMKIIDKQKDKISQLEKSNPEVKSAYEKAVDNAFGLAGDVHKLVREIAESDLSTLRQLQRPDSEVADVMAAVILVLKSHRYDLSWSKGAKRIMANLDRFVELLDDFDKEELSHDQLAAVEQYLKKPFFSVELLEQKSSIKAVPLLCLWVHYVVRYQMMMISRVKPLKAKCSRTLVALEANRVKLKAIEDKVEGFEQRLAGLRDSFESATVEKMQQKQQVLNMQVQLNRAEAFANKMASQLVFWQGKTESLKEREAGINGSSAMAAGMATYLGPFADHYGIRQLLLCIEWPGCLSQRGIPLVLPGIDGKGIISEVSIVVGKEDTGEPPNSNKVVLDSDISTEPSIFSHVPGYGSCLIDFNQAKITDYQLYCESLAGILVSSDAVATWKAKGFGPIMLVNGAILRSCGSYWPLVVDPQGVGLRWIKNVELNRDVVVLNANDR